MKTHTLPILLTLTTTLALAPACDDGGNGDLADTSTAPDATTSDADAVETDADATTGSDVTDPDATDSDASDLDVADAGDGDAGDASDVTDAVDAVDMIDAPDVIDDPELRGTALEGVAVVWPETLALCTPWREGRTVAEERAARMELRLEGRQVRAGLGSLALGESTLDAEILVADGPMADERTWVLEPSVSTVLASHTLSMPAVDQDLVEATLEHTIDGVGVLEETWRVQRRRDEPPRHASVTSWDASFLFTPEGAADGELMVPCDGSDDLEDAIQAVVATRPDAPGESLTILRHAATALAVAGSAPMFVHGHTIHRSAEPWFALEEFGRFSHTYAAAHHNWQDTSIIEVHRDPVQWHQGFAPYADLATATVSEVRFLGIDAFTQGDNLELDVTAVDGNVTSTTWQAEMVGRVDETSLLRNLAAPCASPTTQVTATSVGWFHWALCPAPGTAAGVQPVGMVPMVFFGAPALTGQIVDPTSITEASDEVWAATLREAEGSDTWTVTLDLSTGIGGELTVADPQGVEESAFAVLVDVEKPGAGWPPVEVAQQSADGRVQLSIWRRAVGLGGGNTTDYTPHRVDVVFDGERARIDGLDALEYTVSHHNHGDVLVASWGTGGAPSEARVLRWEAAADGSGTVTIVDGDGALLWGPAVVE